MSGCGGCAFKGQSTAVEHTFVGVRFGEETNLTLCGTGGELLGRGAPVIVEIEGEPTFGHVEQSPMPVFKPCQKSSAKKILRPATDEDGQAFEKQRERELAAKLFCQERARNLNLQMKISKVSFALSGRKATVHFTAEHRVDFRQLVRDVAQRFATRIQMVQVGSRDEAAILGGVGVCGRTLCCSTWLKDFRPISIQMAKRQNLSLNPSKISGQCGRLLCCLSYEDDQYKGAKKPKDETAKAPPAPNAEAS
jgi:cell fate regulator YaaT (PSP1 superfamily)